AAVIQQRQLVSLFRLQRLIDFQQFRPERQTPAQRDEYLPVQRPLDAPRFGNDRLVVKVQVVLPRRRIGRRVGKQNGMRHAEDGGNILALLVRQRGQGQIAQRNLLAQTVDLDLRRYAEHVKSLLQTAHGALRPCFQTARFRLRQAGRQRDQRRRDDAVLEVHLAEFVGAVEQVGGRQSRPRGRDAGADLAAPGGQPDIRQFDRR